MAGVREVAPFAGPVGGVLDLPGSKSLANRALVCAVLASGASVLRGIPDGDDTDAMVDCAERLGADVRRVHGESTVLVVGTSGVLRDGPMELDAHLAGTTSRFVTALAALGQGRYRIDGAGPLRTRPMAPLHDALAALGASLHPDGEWGHLPVLLQAAGLRGGTVALPGDVSSQFVSALMMVGPYAGEGIAIELTTPLVSRPYVDMTAAVMAAFSGPAVEVGERRIVVPPGRYRRADLRIEPDASSASYLWALAALTGGWVRVPGYADPPLQGDAAFVDLLARMGADVVREGDALTVRGTGVVHGIDVDMADLSDTVPTLAVVAAFADSPTRITGVGFIRRKESDRIAAVVEGLRRCGVEAEEEDDGLRIVPAPGGLRPGGAVVATHHDHRLAMSFAVLGAAGRGVTVEDPAVVTKSFPAFWDVLERLRPACG